MNKKKKKRKIKSLCGTSVYRGFKFKYDPEPIYLYILDSSDKLFLGIEEDDFLLDGFQIRKIKDIKKIKKVSKINLNISRSLGLPNISEKPDIDITSWKTALASIWKLNRLFIIENENDGGFFYMGMPCGLYEDTFEFSPKEPNGEWGADITIKYSDLTSITFGDRYSTEWDKYMEKNKEN